MPLPILIFDFDGTVAVGDGPVVAYARGVADAADLGHGFAEEIARRLAASNTSDVIDGYDLVRVAALEAGADDAALAAGYTASREALGSDRAPVATPAGLAELLASVEAERILVTNAPAVRLRDVLAGLGLAGSFDRIVTDAAKPAGLDALLDELAPTGAPVLSIGDVWRNDLAPVHARGHATALVGAFTDPAAVPTYRAGRLEDLLPQIAAWVHGNSDDSR